MDADPFSSMWDVEEVVTLQMILIITMMIERSLDPNEKKLNILGWWKVKSRTFPILSVTAKDLLTSM